MQTALKNNTTPTDPIELIIQGCRENKLQSQEQLYRHCYPLLIGICCRYAGDMDGAGIIFNNAMLRAFKYLHTYRHHDKWLAWLKTIVINCCLDFVKQRNRFREDEIRTAHEETISFSEDALEKISAREIQKLIQQMPKATAIVFNLFVYEGFTHKQIAESLGIAEGTSKWHVNEARKLLKSKLDTHFSYETK